VRDRVEFIAVRFSFGTTTIPSGAIRNSTPNMLRFLPVSNS
jgi:hypothetical protein